MDVHPGLACSALELLPRIEVHPDPALACSPPTERIVGVRPPIQSITPSRIATANPPEKPSFFKKRSQARELA